MVLLSHRSKQSSVLLQIRVTPLLPPPQAEEEEKKRKDDEERKQREEEERRAAEAMEPKQPHSTGRILADLSAAGAAAATASRPPVLGDSTSPEAWTVRAVAQITLSL